MPAISKVSLDSLIDAALPAISPDGFESVCETLISNSSIQGSRKNPRWGCLPQDPSAPGIKPFNFLETVVLAITDADSNILAPDLNFKLTKEAIQAGFCDTYSHSSRGNEYFYLGRQQLESSETNWTDIIMPMWSKNGNETDDDAKVMWLMHKVMWNDPRRRFVHGLTCEDAKARLWYHNRSGVFVSEKFDINQNWKQLVRIISSILLATHDELGYDPGMVLLPPNRLGAQANYDITIHNSDTGKTTIYRTFQLISDIGADHMIGPGTRVWKVQKLLNGIPDGPYYALKDTWVREDCVVEHTLLMAMRKAQPQRSQHFLTPVDYSFAPSAVSPNSTHKIPQVLRQHYRIVFEEIGQPVHDLRNFTDIFTAIQGAWEGLHAMHLSGYVHRDVSSGNILLVPPSGSFGQRGVIMDMEYAKRIDDPSTPPQDMKAVRHARVYGY
ncbi:unnamed protein product [Rhizoctonia solani]|uniref:Fungal-type protein kinase domain-containing protein n=1 Tax=Rhizoctonia solani TaxID=456999 RepID=A0A8H3HYY6_9AGAM|nr:unnamed protein product [Rhizoctonia solani]